MDNRAQIREFLASRRARITPEQAGLPAYGGNRRVTGLRREEVAMLAGVSIDYYVRMERGNLAGASDAVLEGVARALQLDDAERDHLFDLARASEPQPARLRRSREPGVTASVQQVLDAITGAPAWVRNARHDMLAANRLARALYAPLLAGPRRPANNARFVYLDPASRDFFTDWDRAADDIAAMLRSEAGRNPYDKKLVELIGELSTRSEDFRTRWAAHNVRFHRTGHKKLHHPVVGDLDLNFEAMELPSQPGLTLLVYTAPQRSPTADGLTLLASWAATAERTGQSSPTVRRRSADNRPAVDDDNVAGPPLTIRGRRECADSPRFAWSGSQAGERLAAGDSWQDTGLVFTSHLGAALDAGNVRKMFKRICTEAGTGDSWTPRELRTTFVSLMSHQGVSIEEIARLVGHASTRTTEIVYRRELRPVITTGAEIMDQLFSGT